MSVLEVVAGVLLILACVVLILMVLAQDSKGQGLSSVITGTEMMSGESRGRGKEQKQERITKILGISFAVLAVLVNIFSVLNTK